jgi:alpha-ribazole phosphatase
VKNDIRLRELHMGDWEGRLWESFRGPESEAWALDPWNSRPPRGEAAAELWARVADFRAEVQDCAHEKLAVVTHAGVIRAWLGLGTGRSLQEMIAVPVPFGSVHVV